MDDKINAKVAELEKIVRRYYFAFRSEQKSRILAEWRQATKTALENAYLEGYDIAAKAAQERGG